MSKKVLAIISLVILVAIGVVLFMTFNNSKSENKGNVDNTPTKNVENINEDENKKKEEREENNMNSQSKIAVVYFSATGTTESVAKYIEEATSGDIFEIIPASEYTSSDLNYNNNNSRANREQNNDSARPEIANKINIDSYDTIYLGFPIWWGDVPKIILTFLDTYDLSGKTVIPFCTSGSTGISGSMNTLRNYNKNVNWKDGRRFTTSSKEEINRWVKGGN